MKELLSVLLTCIFVIAYPPLRRALFAPGREIAAKISLDRIPFFDFVKGLAILAVITIHAGSLYGDSIGSTSAEAFLWAANNLCRFAIGFFLISSGMLITIPRDDSWPSRQFFTSKLHRIMGPYILCVLAICIANGTNWREGAYMLLTGRAALPYYFLVVLFQLYLLSPLLAKYSAKQWFLPVILLIGLMSFFRPFNPGGFVICVAEVFYFAYGIARRERAQASARINRAEAAGWISVVVLYVLSFAFYPGFFYNRSFFYSIACFELVRYFWKDLQGNYYLNAGLQYLGRHSLWIYLVHYWVVMKVCSLVVLAGASAEASLLAIVFLGTVLSLGLSLVLEALYGYVGRVIAFITVDRRA